MLEAEHGVPQFVRESGALNRDWLVAYIVAQPNSAAAAANLGEGGVLVILEGVVRDLDALRTDWLTAVIRRPEGKRKGDGERGDHDVTFCGSSAEASSTTIRLFSDLCSSTARFFKAA